MEVRITYSNEIYLKGETLKDIKDKWENLNLDIDKNQDDSITDFGYVELVSVEDANGYRDLGKEWRGI